MGAQRYHSRGGGVCRRLAARGESPASHRDGRGARRSRREEGEYGQYSSDEQRRAAGCIARRMQRDFHHGLLGVATTIRLRENGPIVVEGDDVIVIDWNGRPYTIE